MAKGTKGRRKTKKNGSGRSKVSGAGAVDSSNQPSAVDDSTISEHRRVEAAAFLRAGFSSLVAESPSVEHAFSEMAIHGALSVLMERGRRFGVAPVCCRCSADPNETECMLFAVDASGQLRPAGKIPKSEAGNYVPCG